MALRKISPVEYLSSECVPTAVFQGRLDTIVPFSQVEKFIGKLTEYGVENTLLIYENSDHALDKDPDCTEKSREIINEYAEKYLRF
jgi:dipeptidyl aminopeptidase/acylaminoacyl peptidase